MTQLKPIEMAALSPMTRAYLVSRDAESPGITEVREAIARTIDAGLPLDRARAIWEENAKYAGAMQAAAAGEPVDAVALVRTLAFVDDMVCQAARDAATGPRDGLRLVW